MPTKETIYKIATGLSSIFVIANAVASFYFYYEGDVLRGLFFIGGANLSMMMMLNFVRIIENINAINPIKKRK